MTVDLSSSHMERLWTAPDGTFCVLTTDAAPPSYTLALMRGDEVLRERRLYALATAQMLAMGWRESAESREQFLARLLSHGRSVRQAAQGSGMSSGDGMNH